MNVDNLNARHKPALFTTKLEIHGFFKIEIECCFFFLASDLKGPKHDLRFLIFMYIKWIICVF